MVDIQPAAAEIRRGKKRKKIDRRKKPQDKNIMACSRASTMASSEILVQI